MKKLLFVCTGNTCRSAMAEAIFRAKISKAKLGRKFRVASAGVAAYEGQPISATAGEALKKRGIKSDKHKARRFSLDMIAKYDYIIVMTENHLRYVGNFQNVCTYCSLSGRQGDIPDPYGASIADYERVADIFEADYDIIMQKINANEEKEVTT